MLKTKIIAISGYRKSGKDTAAEFLAEVGYQRFAFADALKERVAEDYNIPLNSLYDQELKEEPLLTHPVEPKDDFSLNICNFMFREFRSEYGELPKEVYVDSNGEFLGVVEGGMPVPLYHTPRSLAIFEGSTKRTIFPNFWTNLTIKQINKLRDSNILSMNNTLAVIPDLRFRNEIDELKQAFGDNLITVRVNRFDTVDSSDPSELDLDGAKFDVVIDNKTTLEEFKAKVLELQ